MTGLQTVQGRAHTEAVEAAYGDEITALTEQGHLGPYVSAMERVAAALSITIPEGQGLAVAVRLHAHGCTPEQARVIADLLADDQDFSDGITRFNRPMMPAHWTAKLAKLPRMGGRYSADERHAWAVYGYRPEDFKEVTGDALDPRPFTYTGPIGRSNG